MADQFFDGNGIVIMSGEELSKSRGAFRSGEVLRTGMAVSGGSTAGGKKQSGGNGKEPEKFFHEKLSFLKKYVFLLIYDKKLKFQVEIIQMMHYFKEIIKFRKGFFEKICWNIHFMKSFWLHRKSRRTPEISAELHVVPGADSI
jgi:hypothetical protein